MEIGFPRQGILFLASWGKPPETLEGVLASARQGFEATRLSRKLVPIVGSQDGGTSGCVFLRLGTLSFGLVSGETKGKSPWVPKASL